MAIFLNHTSSIITSNRVNEFLRDYWKDTAKARELQIFPFSVFKEVAMGNVHAVTPPVVLLGLTEVVFFIVQEVFDREFII